MQYGEHRIIGIHSWYNPLELTRLRVSRGFIVIYLGTYDNYGIMQV